MTSSAFEIISWKHVSAHMGTYRYFLENQYSNHKGLYTFPHMTLLIILHTSHQSVRARFLLWTRQRGRYVKQISLNAPHSVHLHLRSRSPADGTHLEIKDSRGPKGLSGDSGTSANTPATHLTGWPNTSSHSGTIISSSESAFQLVLRCKLKSWF